MQGVAGEHADIGVAGGRRQVADQREHGEQGQPADRDEQYPAPVQPDPGDRHGQQQEAGHHGDGAAHLAAEPGPARREHGEHRDHGHGQDRGAPGRWVPAQQDQGQPARAEQTGQAVDAEGLVADAVEPAGLQHGQAERGLQLQPRPGHHVDPQHGHGEQADHAERRERAAVTETEQRGARDDQGQRDRDRVEPGGRVRGGRPGHQVSQEGARGHRGGEHPGHQPAPGPAPPLAVGRAP